MVELLNCEHHYELNKITEHNLTDGICLMLYNKHKNNNIKSKKVNPRSRHHLNEVSHLDMGVLRLVVLKY